MLKVKKPFKFAYGGIDVVEFKTGDEIPDGDECTMANAPAGCLEKSEDATPAATVDDHKNKPAAKHNRGSGRR